MDVTTALVMAAFAFGVGAYGTVIGAGGGFVLIPGLVLLFELEGAEAVGTGVVTLLAIGLSGAIAYDRAGMVDRTGALWFALGTVPSALLCAWLLSARIDRSLFADLLGILLLALAVFVLATSHSAADRATGCPDGRRTLLPPCGAAVGFLSGTFAVGGGLVTLPILARTRRLTPHRAAATTAAASMLGTIGGAAGHIAAGNVVWRDAGVLIVGAAAGSAVGARVARRLSARLVLALVAVGLVGAGVPLLLG